VCRREALGGRRPAQARSQSSARAGPRGQSASRVPALPSADWTWSTRGGRSAGSLQPRPALPRSKTAHRQPLAGKSPPRKKQCKKVTFSLKVMVIECEEPRDGGEGTAE
jgi:hypothetical protein